MFPVLIAPMYRKMSESVAKTRESHEKLKTLEHKQEETRVAIRHGEIELQETYTSHQDAKLKYEALEYETEELEQQVQKERAKIRLANLTVNRIREDIKTTIDETNRLIHETQQCDESTDAAIQQTRVSEAQTTELNDLITRLDYRISGTALLMDLLYYPLIVVS